MIYLHKILPLLISPLAISLFLILIGLWTRRRRYGLTAVFIVVIFALPITERALIRYLEKDQNVMAIDDVSRADAIVVLSGMSSRTKRQGDILMEFNSAVDRYFAGLALIQAEKAPVLIFTNGILPWQQGVPEGEFLAAQATAHGIAENHIQITELVENTAAEAKAVKRMMRSAEDRIILVTSAFHMPRASRLFSATGLEVIPYPVDFRANDSRITAMDFIPSARALGGSSYAIREMLGRGWYALSY